MKQISERQRAKAKRISSRPKPDGTTEHEYQIEGVDLSTDEGYWSGVNAIRERLYRGSP
jgi:hypothetical protein